METNFAIADLVVMDLTPRGTVLPAMKESDQLLRRFGQVDVIMLDAAHPQTILRKKADEVWVVLEGTAAFSLKDRREDSPTFDGEVSLTLEGYPPQAMLLPFGTECRVSTSGTARLLRMTTHEDSTDSGDLLPA